MALNWGVVTNFTSGQRNLPVKVEGYNGFASSSSTVPFLNVSGNITANTSLEGDFTTVNTDVGLLESLSFNGRTGGTISYTLSYVGVEDDLTSAPTTDLGDLLIYCSDFLGSQEFSVSATLQYDQIPCSGLQAWPKKVSGSLTLYYKLSDTPSFTGGTFTLPWLSGITLSAAANETAKTGTATDGERQILTFTITGATGVPTSAPVTLVAPATTTTS